MPTDPDYDTRADRLGVQRRSLLKAMSAGTGLAVGGAGVVAGRNVRGDGKTDDDGKTTEDDRQRNGEIDPLYGFSSPDGGDPPEGIQPSHTVDLLVEYPEPPEGAAEDGAGEGDGDTDAADEDGDADSSDEGSEDGGSETERPEFDHPPLFIFEPVGLHVSPGDVVQFTFTTQDHTITAYHRGHGFQHRVPEGVPPFSSPIVNVGGYWLYRFDEPGVYDVYCGPHHFFGMVMRVVVGDLAEEDVPDYATSPPQQGGPPSSEQIAGLLNAFREENCEWPLLSPAEIFGANSLDPTAIQESGTVPFSAVASDLGYDYQPGDAMGGGDEADGEAAPDATVGVHEHAEHGPILVGPDGTTLYVFDRDERGAAESACYDDCAENWPPLTVDDDPTTAEAVVAELTTFEREDGQRQVAANGWPLYYFAADEQPGDATGQGANDVWWVLRPDGTPVRPDSDA